MNMSNLLENIVQYLTEAFTRIFSPMEESLPKIGVQPFGCALYWK